MGCNCKSKPASGSGKQQVRTVIRNSSPSNNGGAKRITKREIK